MVLTVSARRNSIGPAIAEWFIGAVHPMLKELNATLHLESLANLALPFSDEDEHPYSGIYAHEHTRAWSALVAGSDGFIVLTPEYNYGMPATLKNALDYLSREWAWKPIGFVSYGMTSAGTRAVQHAKQVVSTMRLVPLGATVAIRLTDSVVDGRVVATPRLDAAAQGVLSETVRLPRALLPMREVGQLGVQPGPLAGSYLRRLTSDDAGEVTVLQRCSWVDEALVNATLDHPALTESVDDVAQWLDSEGVDRWQAWGLWLDGRLIAMVRTLREASVGHIGRLAVAPDLRGAGLGRWLLRAAEARLGDVDSVQLFTGAKSVANIALYESEGFVRVPAAPEPGVVELRKLRSAG